MSLPDPTGQPAARIDALPVYLTGDLPPIPGTIKNRPEDFLVDEIPAYTPCGEGEHLYLTIQKRNLSTMDLLRIVASHFRVGRGAVGYAGLKDKHAITRQMVSVHVPGRGVADFPQLDHPDVAVLGAAMHTNKLRPGHLRGNRFSIRIRGCAPTHARIAHLALERLARIGVPNRVGEQRFGLLENNHIVGTALALGDFEAAVRSLLGPCPTHPDRNTEGRRLFAEGKFREAIPYFPIRARSEAIVLNMLAQGRAAREALLRLDDTVLNFYLSAFQSAAFNSVLDARVANGTIATLAPGDVAFKHENGSLFAIDDPTTGDPETARRLAAVEISPTGPMWGASMLRATGGTDATEVRSLESLGVTPEALAQRQDQRPSLRGARRPLRVPLLDPEVEGGVDEVGAYIRCAFELPRGAFATVVMREVMKPTTEPDTPTEE